MRKQARDARKARPQVQVQDGIATDDNDEKPTTVEVPQDAAAQEPLFVEEASIGGDTEEPVKAEPLPESGDPFDAMEAASQAEPPTEGEARTVFIAPVSTGDDDAKKEPPPKKASGEKTKKGAKLTTEDRLSAAANGGGFIELILNGAAKMLGSGLTVDRASESLLTGLDRLAQGASGNPAFSLGKGIPVDIAPGPQVVRSFVMVARRTGNVMEPVRFCPGDAIKLEPGEVLAANPASPADGELFAVNITGNIAHAVAANLATGPKAAAEKIEKFIQEHEEAFRIGYAVLLSAAFIGMAWNDSRIKVKAEEGK